MALFVNTATRYWQVLSNVVIIKPITPYNRVFKKKKPTTRESLALELQERENEI
jgi:hypothetical protein